MRRREVMHEFCTWAYKSPIWNSQYTIPNATTSTNMVGWLVGWLVATANNYNKTLVLTVMQNQT